jgi:hypothetical protein
MNRLLIFAGFLSVTTFSSAGVETMVGVFVIGGGRAGGSFLMRVFLSENRDADVRCLF